MKDEYDFSNAKHGPVVPLPSHQTEVRLRLDNDILEWLRECANKASGGSYQILINTFLRTQMEEQEDAGLVQAIKQGEGSGTVSRGEVYAVLQRQS